MSKIKLFENVKKKLLSRNHPLIGFDSTIKYTYFTGIAIIADSANEDKTKKQKACSKISTLLDELSGSLDLSNDLYLKALEIGKNPDEGIVNDIVELLDQKIIRFLFLLDSHAMLKSAGNENNEEANQIINSLMQMFMFTEIDHEVFEELKISLLNKDYEKFFMAMARAINEEEVKNAIIKFYFPEEYKRSLPEIKFPVENKEQAVKDTETTIEVEKKKNANIEKIDIGDGIALEMVYIEPGKFIMGSNNRGDDASPPHEVAITKGFYMGKYPVTQEQWVKIMGSNPSRFSSVSLKNPVDNVSWEDCQEFIKKLNALKKYNGTFRLPTEAEWEYACRAGSTTEYYWGNDINEDYCWYVKNSKGSTQPVGQKKPNDFGLYDMSGNVFEWCGDWFGDYEGFRMVDPAGPARGSDRVFRGGGWYGIPRYCRSAIRIYSDPSYRYSYGGFRLALPSGR